MRLRTKLAFGAAFATGYYFGAKAGRERYEQLRRAIDASAGALAIAGGVGIWKRRPWGWVSGVLTTAVVTLGTLVAMAFSETGTPLVLGAVLGTAGMVAVWWPATRRGCGI